MGNVVLGTLVKHYIARNKAKHAVQLRRDELMYDEVFNIVKRFMDMSTQNYKAWSSRTPPGTSNLPLCPAFLNTRTPAPPSVLVVRVLVPMSTCDEAAKLLIKVLGGEEHTRRVVGGVKWWTVRGVEGVDAQWIATKRDWNDAKKRYEEQSDTPDQSDPAANGSYNENLDEMRCILYFHGGGYFFGSVDQERYSIQRFARKIHGRVFAVNYRLAPQYPFPCALQDALASYLYLISPPEGAKHRAVNPAHIIISGDSAGGGLSLALLQIIRDLGLPAPAGGVLISPWCDLTHSFPSVHTNTATDVIPSVGLSLYKPSPLWPPPPEEMTQRVHASLRSRIRETLKLDHHAPHDKDIHPVGKVPTTSQETELPVNVGKTVSVPGLNDSDYAPLSMTTESGETLTIKGQVHVYTTNRLLAHPLISPAMSYLGGLPPLHIIAGDKEVLRDEIIYTAHMAANPQKYPIRDDKIREMYPPLRDIESKAFNPTAVHLQVYDDTAHILPILFAFTTPAKFCFRAIAAFSRHVTGMKPNLQSPASTLFSEGTPSSSRRPSEQKIEPVITEAPKTMTDLEQQASPTISSQPAPSVASTSAGRRRSSLQKSLSKTFSTLQRRASLSVASERMLKPDSAADGGPSRSKKASPAASEAPAVLYAGDAVVYTNGDGDWDGRMIRERVSTKGVIRALEPESELDAMKVPTNVVGTISELAMRRFINGSASHSKKYAGRVREIERHRASNLKKAEKGVIKNMSVLESSIKAKEDDRKDGKGGEGSNVREGLIPSTGSWSWAWVLDGSEKPPPSSIVSRRDTAEAMELAKIADLGVFELDHRVTGNNLWQILVNFLTVNNGDKDGDLPAENSGLLRANGADEDGTLSGGEEKTSPRKSFFSKKAKSSGCVLSKRPPDTQSAVPA
ncbi:alpha/beta-hydrolase [Cylindrobasidium torrendii FP15055 ss-10]|uniref:Alpha/beta-hydrolase n=1 Tax=Cylindrobasidium torrendii FP15055 ss-10 TaxID=1314674 RepID=A0A0D7BC57_9AGAR|nr:alpha/beta-hydrolase [Cylindrobasidium torrendii FP15055 ss-10]